MEVLTVFHEIEKGSYVYQVMGYNDKASMVHINNIKTNEDSVIVPIEVLQRLLKDLELYSSIPI